MAPRDEVEHELFSGGRSLGSYSYATTSTTTAAYEDDLDEEEDNPYIIMCGTTTRSSASASASASSPVSLVVSVTKPKKQRPPTMTTTLITTATTKPRTTTPTIMALWSGVSSQGSQSTSAPPPSRTAAVTSNKLKKQKSDPSLKSSSFANVSKGKTKKKRTGSRKGGSSNRSTSTSSTITTTKTNKTKKVSKKKTTKKTTKIRKEPKSVNFPPRDQLCTLIPRKGENQDETGQHSFSSSASLSSSSSSSSSSPKCQSPPLKDLWWSEEELEQFGQEAETVACFYAPHYKETLLSAYKKSWRKTKKVRRRSSSSNKKSLTPNDDDDPENDTPLVSMRTLSACSEARGLEPDIVSSVLTQYTAKHCQSILAVQDIIVRVRGGSVTYHSADWELLRQKSRQSSRVSRLLAQHLAALDWHEAQNCAAAWARRSASSKVIGVSGGDSLGSCWTV